MPSLKCLFLLSTSLSLATAIRYYQNYDLQQTIESTQVDAACITALNSSVSCNEESFASLADPDLWAWDSGNLTRLCTSTCSSSLESWHNAVKNACGSQPFSQEGLISKAEAIPALIKYGQELVCLKTNTNGWCFLEDRQRTGQDYWRNPTDLCDTGDPALDHPDCFEPGFDQTVIEPNDRRLTTLYSRQEICSDCFVKMFHKRLLSPFFDGSEYSDNLVDQWNDIKQFCTTSLPFTRSTQTYLQGIAEMPTPPPGSATPTQTNPATTTCTGQLVQATPLSKCKLLSEEYNVPDGHIAAILGNTRCDFDELPSACLPLPCELYTVEEYGETCDTIVEKLSTPEKPVFLTQFLTWNPFIRGNCDRVFQYQRLCRGPAGGAYVAPPPIHAPTKTSEYFETATPPVPTQSGTISDCGKYHVVRSGDTCQTVSFRYGLTFAKFRELNPQIDSDCRNLWLDTAYCVARVTNPDVSTDGSCGPSNGHKACPSGTCCSRHGFCGTGSDFCGSGNCYSGECEDPTSSISPDGTCGPQFNHWTCPGSAFGDCCSTSGYCGSTSDYCAAGNCYSGACSTDEGGPSVDGSCGPNFQGNKVCQGSPFGNCCSIHGYCGSTSDYCAAGNCYSGACQS